MAPAKGLRHHVGLFFPILIASGFGYFIYNLGLVLGFVKPSTVGLVQCAQSFGTIGCPDTVNGLLYVIIGALMIFAVFTLLGYGFGRNRRR